MKNIFVCNGAKSPNLLEKTKNKICVLDYRKDNPNRLINISIKKFYENLNYLPNRIIDLLEIASYVFNADRLSSRGSIYNLEYHSWSREFEFYIKVRDTKFWNQEVVKTQLSKALQFMSGDKKYEFHFEGGLSNTKDDLFDNSDFKIDFRKKNSIILFSGGLDSLTGAIDTLENTENNVWLVSHQSNNRTTRTQQKLFQTLNEKYSNKIFHYPFICTLKGHPSIDESQRTRAFLYNSIAFALAKGLSENEYYLFENGVTSINFPRRQDLINARASRTTHPKTVYLLQKLWDSISTNDNTITIKTPYYLKTKTDLFNILKKYKKSDLIPSSVSCSNTRIPQTCTHCGKCFQCIDRRFAAISSDLNEIDDSGIYGANILSDVLDNNTITAITDYLAQAKKFYEITCDEFAENYLKEMLDIYGFIDFSDSKTLEEIYNLCNKHGKQVLKSIQLIREKENVFAEIIQNSIYEIISGRPYTKESNYLLANRISSKLITSIPIAFKTDKPRREEVLNDHINAFIKSESSNYHREFPTVRFALAKVVPDHEYSKHNLLIETKYIRGKTTPSVITDGIAADLIKYPDDALVLFIIYDPERQITDDDRFIKDFESKKRKAIFKIIR